MDFAQRLMADAAPVWEQYYAHPFIQGMIDGTLDKEKFAGYLMQDSQYLKEYAKVYAIAFVKTDDIGLMRRIYRDMSVILSDESMMHIRYLKDLGYSEADALRAPTQPENRAYLDFMLKTAAEGTACEGLVAMTPCTFSYYHIAKYAREQACARKTIEGNYYAGWINDYIAPAYAGIYQRTYDMVNELAEDLTEAERSKLKQIFYRSSEYELAFWDMAMRGSR